MFTPSVDVDSSWLPVKLYIYTKKMKDPTQTKTQYSLISTTPTHCMISSLANIKISLFMSTKRGEITTMFQI